MVERARALAPAISERAADAEHARDISDESAADLIAAGFPSMLVPDRFGGTGLGLETWFDAVVAIARADASHAWLASLMAHVPHMVAQFSLEAQEAVWADGPDTVIAGSVMPLAEVSKVAGGYAVSARSPFASGVLHSSWVFVGGFLPGGGPPDPALFLIPPGAYEVERTWFTSGMRATGSNTIVTDGVVVPGERVLRMADLREGQGPGSTQDAGPLYRIPFVSYSPLAFTGPMLGAALGALERFAQTAANKTLPGGRRFAEAANVQTGLGRAASDLRAAELLLRRIAQTATTDVARTLRHRSECMADASRATELILDAIDCIIRLGGTSSFAESNPVQRAWRDIHFAASHVSVSTETNYGHWGREALGVDRPASQALF